MKKIICIFAVVLMLVFSCVPAFAVTSPFVDVPNMTQPPWVYGGNYTVENVILNGVSLRAIAPKAKNSAYGFLNVKPVSSTRKYTFRFDVYCTTTDNINTTGISAKVYYQDPGSNETILLWESNPSNRFWVDNGYKTVERTVTFPESFQSSTGRLYYSIKNDSDKSTACLSIYNLHITDMTTADLDNSIDKGVEKIENAGSDSPPLDTDISAFQSAIDTMNGWLDQLDAFADSIDSAGQTVSSYISKGTELFNGFMGIAPASVIALVAFGVVFLVIRKIVGR